MTSKGADPVAVMEKQIDALQNKLAAAKENHTLSSAGSIRSRQYRNKTHAKNKKKSCSTMGGFE